VIFSTKNHIWSWAIICGIILFLFSTNISANLIAEEITNETDADTCTNGNNADRACENKSLFSLRGNQGLTLIVFMIAFVIISIFGILFMFKRQFLRQQEAFMPLQRQMNDPVRKKENSNAEQYRNLVTRMLSSDEKRIVKELINQNGTMLQSQISRMPNMGKVKAHRTVKRLERKDIVTITDNGKTNRISFTDNLREVFLA
jgi:uncharacterized membrane protein